MGSPWYSASWTGFLRQAMSLPQVWRPAPRGFEKTRGALRVLFFSMAAAVAFAQPQTSPLGAGPWTYTTYEKSTNIRVSVVTRELSHPWSLAFLPSGDVLIRERPGRLRLMTGDKIACRT